MEKGLLVYVCWMAVSVLLSFGLFGAVGLKREKGAARTAALSLLLGTVLGLACAKAVYYLCQINFMIAEGWLNSLRRLSPEYLNFYGGAAGVCFGVAWSAKLTGRNAVETLNRFAPYGLLLAALARFGEYFLGMLGVGTYLENEAFCFAPLAKGFSYGSDWTEWYLAVCVLEGITLLAVALISGCVLKEHRFLRSVFYFCLPQILLENLRMSSMMWFFCVRVDQLICMIAMLVILIMYGTRGRSLAEKAGPACIAVLCAGLFIVCEFALEGKIPFLRFLNSHACYALMALGEAVLAWTEIRAFRRFADAERQRGKRTA